MNLKTVQVLFIVAALLAGCNKQSDATHSQNANITQHGQHVEAATFKGKVTQTMNAAGYTYVAITQDGKEVWGALEETELKVGDDVEFAIDTPVDNFKSKTLDRTFDKIYFLKPLAPVATTEVTLPANHPAVPGIYPAPEATPNVADTTVAAGSIAKASNGYTVAEVFSKKSELSGKTVVIRGKVVKFTPNIMGRNWLHIKDGSAADGGDDLTITTNDTVAVGDVVLATGGALAVDKDFGAGYKYTAILENAAVKVE